VTLVTNVNVFIIIYNSLYIQQHPKKDIKTFKNILKALRADESDYANVQCFYIIIDLTRCVRWQRVVSSAWFLCVQQSTWPLWLLDKECADAGSRAHCFRSPAHCDHAFKYDPGHGCLPGLLLCVDMWWWEALQRADLPNKSKRSFRNGPEGL